MHYPKHLASEKHFWHAHFNPLGSEVILGPLRCFDMPWYLCLFQLLITYYWPTCTLICVTKINRVFLVSFALIFKKLSWYRRRYGRLQWVKILFDRMLLRFRQDVIFDILIFLDKWNSVLCLSAHTQLLTSCFSIHTFAWSRICLPVWVVLVDGSCMESRRHGWDV